MLSTCNSQQFAYEMDILWQTSSNTGCWYPKRGKTRNKSSWEIVNFGFVTAFVGVHHAFVGDMENWAISRREHQGEIRRESLDKAVTPCNSGKLGFSNTSHDQMEIQWLSVIWGGVHHAFVKGFTMLLSGKWRALKTRSPQTPYCVFRKLHGSNLESCSNRTHRVRWSFDIGRWCMQKIFGFRYDKVSFSGWRRTRKPHRSRVKTKTILRRNFRMQWKSVTEDRTSVGNCIIPDNRAGAARRLFVWFLPEWVRLCVIHETTEPPDHPSKTW